MLTLELIQAARTRLADRLPLTPLVPSATLSQRLGVRVSLKLECLQKTGSFKPRGAFNKLLSLGEEQRVQGVVAVSGGNHAQGVAYAARELGVAATICMPQTTPANYLEATRNYGAQILLCSDIAAAFAQAEELQSSGRCYIHPFDDLLVAAGQGTIGLEILEQAPDVTHVYVSIGGGGLLAGVGTALKSRKPDLQLIGVETEGADAMARSLAQQRLVEIAITSIARTLGAPRVSEFTLQAARTLAREVVVVSDAEAVDSLIYLLERTKILTEPAASCTLAAALRHREQFRSSDHVVLLLCGGNVSVADICTFRQRFSAG